MQETRTIKVRLADYRRLKVMAAERGITMLALIECLVKQEDAKKHENPSDKSS